MKQNEWQRNESNGKWNTKIETAIKRTGIGIFLP